jgi:8-oxo-dGTP pyrophosphatase MutT (NUDIX family)
VKPVKPPKDAKAAKAVGIQYAALPYRIVGRRVDILLITSRQTRRWVIPKGWPMRGLKPQLAAAIEATEEAGLLGEAEAKPIGSYKYEKQMKAGRAIAVQVIVFPFLVEDQAEAWKEQGQREFRWFRYQSAANLVAEPSLSRLIREFGKARTPGILTVLDSRPLRWAQALIQPNG